MKLALNVDHEHRGEDLHWRLTYGLLLPLFVVSEGVSRLYSHYAAEGDEPAPPRGLWIAEARSQASIATSYALMAKSMLRSSERRSRSERLSRH
jgi:hypothetical protein